MEIPQQGTVLLYFTAPWCGPCRQMAPIFESTMEDLKDNLTGVKISVDDEPILSSKYNVSAIPTFIMLKDGKETARTKGGMSKAKFLDFIENNIS